MFAYPFSELMKRERFLWYRPTVVAQVWREERIQLNPWRLIDDVLTIDCSFYPWLEKGVGKLF